MAKKTVQQNNIAKDESGRPPVIAVVGHIDHGKSTLLDYIRKSNIVAGEAGGITQHISAYEVLHQKKDETGTKKITFLDTPGHEAFSEMRRRGASIADIAILIVSAEDGVKPQTIESIEAIKAGNIPYVVAVTKIDKPNANPDKVRQELAEIGVYVEGYGGSVPIANISAKTGEGIDDLLDLLLLVAELEELKASPKIMASGFVLESKLDPQTGPLITLIIKDGHLNLGDYVGIGGKVAKIKRIENFLGAQEKTVTVSAPIRIFGFPSSAEAGSAFMSFDNKKDADNYLKNFTKGEKSSNLKFNPEDSKDKVDVPLVVKSDSEGTLEAVIYEIKKITDDRVNFKIVSSGIGAISDNDLKLVAGSTDMPLVVGFHVKEDRGVKDLAERHNITVATFDIIYKLTDWLKEKIASRRPLVSEEQIIGTIKVLKCFSQNKDKQVLGGRVDSGVIKKGSLVKIFRRDIEIGRGKVAELQEQKIATTEVAEGQQFGTMIESKITIAPGDKLETIEMITS